MSMSMEEREDFIMVHGISSSRNAHFLKPIANILPCNDIASHTLPLNPRNLHFEISMKGGCPQKNWKEWVEQMLNSHERTWKEAGIYEAILASTYNIKKQKTLVIALAEKWRVETNTFVFQWGEATVTLEDMVVLGGFSVLGKPVFDLLDSVELVTTYYSFKDICTGTTGSYYGWMKHFMGKGEEVEHIAFLILWLSRYVFPVKKNVIATNVFPIAVHLSKGVKIALAPAVLASIYNELSLLKDFIDTFEEDNPKISVCSPLYLIQIWAWERFPKLRPNPCSIRDGEPRIARWGKLGPLRLENIRELINCSQWSFEWRPYIVPLENFEFDKWYKADELYVLIDSDMEIDVEEFVRFVRVSELVGLDCIQQYFPHRVAMQFGFDQDLPGSVIRQNESQKMAWLYYNRKIRGAFVYIPPKLFEASVSTRYFNWWYSKNLREEDAQKKRRRVAVKEELSDQLEMHNASCSYDIMPLGNTCTLVEDEDGAHVNIGGMMEDGDTSEEDESGEDEPENMEAANLHKASSSGKDRETGGSDLTKEEIELRLRNIEKLIRDLRVKISH